MPPGRTVAARACGRFRQGLLIGLVGTLLVSCMGIAVPRQGQPLPTGPDSHIVFGRAAIMAGDRLVPPTNPGTDWTDTGPGPRPELSVYLLRLSPRRVARPVFSGSGEFYWSLAPGDYLLIGSPAEDVGEPEVSQRHWPLAALRVPAEPGIVCAGRLTIEVETHSVALEPGLSVNFGLGGVSVADDCQDAVKLLESRFGPVAAEPARSLLVAAGHLSFEDPDLFESARTLLDGANRPR